MEGELSEGVKAYLDSLHSGLVSQIKSLEAIVVEKNNRIDAIETSVLEKDNRIADLSCKVSEGVRRNIEISSELKTTRSELANLQKAFSKLQGEHNALVVKVDDCQQYTRKQCLRIEGIETLPNENNDKLWSKAVSTLNSFGAKIRDTDIFRLHRSGKPHKSKKDGVRVAQTIVRFNNWSARKRAYQANHQAKEKKARQHIRLDLTARRMELLEEAREALYDHAFAHAYADAECNLLVKNRNNDERYFFNTYDELVTALSMVGVEPVTDPESDASDDENGDTASDHEDARSVDSNKLVDSSCVSSTPQF